MEKTELSERNRMRYLKFLIIPLVIFALVYLMIYEPTILKIELVEGVGFPMGTVISWLLVLLIPLFFYLILSVKNDTSMEGHLKLILKFLTFSGLLWGVISYFLSGNWNFVFQKEQHFYIWIAYTVFNVLTPIIIFMIWSIFRLIRLTNKYKK
jgi:hypothetical protein